MYYIRLTIKECKKIFLKKLHHYLCTLKNYKFYNSQQQKKKTSKIFKLYFKIGRVDKFIIKIFLFFLMLRNLFINNNNKYMFNQVQKIVILL